MTNKFDTPLMENAVSWSKMSPSRRLNVGAVIAKDYRTIMSGYNGTPPGEDNNCENFLGHESHLSHAVFPINFDFKEWCSHMEHIYVDHNEDHIKNTTTVFFKASILETKPSVIHAEDNAIRMAKEHNLDISGCSMYVTHAPCINCAKKIIDSKISRVVFLDYYRDTNGIDLLKNNGVEVVQHHL